MGSKPSKHNDKKVVVAAASRKPAHNGDHAAAAANTHSAEISGSFAPSDSNERGSPERRGFNNPRPARRESSGDRTNNRQTRMVGAEDMDGGREALDERPFHQEKVNRVPTKALLKPPKNPNSMIADPDDEYDLY